MRGNLIGKTAEASDREVNWEINDQRSTHERLRRAHAAALGEAGRLFEWHGDRIVSRRLPGGAKDVSDG